MLTRGYFIGEIVDEMANLAGQVRMRNALHLFDLTVATENYFRDFLNIALSANLKNLNAERSNEPGLDLGDESMAWAAAGSVDTDLSFLSLLELYGTEIAERRMPSRRVVEALDVVEYI